MTKSEFVIRPATPEDVESWYGKKQRASMRAIVGELEGEIVAIGGVYREEGAMVGLVGVRHHVRHRRRDLALMAREGRKILQDYAFVVAFADKDEPTADGLIRHFGFEHHGSTKLGEVYLWTNKHKGA